MAEKVLYTYEDYLELPDDGTQYQVVGGELFVSPAPRVRHQIVSSNLEYVLQRHLREEGGEGLVLRAPTDVVLSDLDVVQPDLLFVPPARLDVLTEKAVMGPPALVVEVLSPSTRDLDLGPKMALYGREGVEEAWIVDPDEGWVERRDTGGEGEVVERLEAADDRLRSDLLPGFSVELREVFTT